MGPMVESFRFVTTSVKSTTTPSIVPDDQEIFRDPTPFTMASRLPGEGGPIFVE